MKLYEINKDNYINVNTIISIQAINKKTIIQYGIGQNVFKQTINKEFDDVYNEIIDIGEILEKSLIGINHELEQIKRFISAFYNNRRLY